MSDKITTTTTQVPNISSVIQEIGIGAIAKKHAEAQAIYNSLEKRERELDALRTSLQARFAEREKQLAQEAADHAKTLQDRENALQEREHAFREATAEMNRKILALESGHASLQAQSHQNSVEHQKALEDLERQKELFRAEAQEKIEAKAAAYVNGALASLASSESLFRWISLGWLVAGLLATLSGLALAYFLAVEGTKDIIANKDIGWTLTLFFAAKGVILLGLIYAVVRFCSRLGRSYMHESLKSAERRHAINYGKFYLSAYGAGSDWDKVKEVFAHWNISGASAFYDQSHDSTDRTSALNIEDTVKVLIPALQKVAEGAAK